MSDKSSQLTSFLNGGNPQNGLSIALSNPPYEAAPAQKQKDIDAVVGLLVAVKEAQMAESVNKLSIEELDVLAKYLYKGMESGVNSAALFKWFAVVQAKAGHGSLVRVMTDSNKL